MATLVRAMSLGRPLLAVGSLELEGFLAEVESGHFGVEVLELHPELWLGPPWLLECVVLEDSMGGSPPLVGTAWSPQALWLAGMKEPMAWESPPGMWRGESPAA